MKRLSWILLLLLGTKALGYTLPADFIMAEVAKNCLPLGKVQFLGTVTDSGKVSFATLLLTHTGLHITKKLPIEHRSEKPDEVKASENVALSFVSGLLGCANQEQVAIRLMSYLSKAAIDVKTVTHGLYHYEPVLIIGAHPHDSTSPQLWIDKSTFLPVKEIGPDRVVTYEKWAVLNSIHKKKFPSIMTITAKNMAQTIAISEKPGE